MSEIVKAANIFLEDMALVGPGAHRKNEEADREFRRLLALHLVSSKALCYPVVTVGVVSTLSRAEDSVSANPLQGITGVDERTSRGGKTATPEVLKKKIPIQFPGGFPVLKFQ